MQSIVSKGKNIQEAIYLGLDLLEASKSEVEIEIINNETKGFLGIGSKMAVVKLTRRNNSASTIQKEPVKSSFDLAEQLLSEMSEKELPKLEVTVDNGTTSLIQQRETEDLLGKVWIRDGKLYYQSSQIRVPMITVKDGVKLYKDDELMNPGTFILSDKHTYELYPLSDEKETQWKITMDEHKQKVMLQVEPGYKISRTIQDTEPDYHIDVRVLEEKEPINHLDYTDVVNELERMNVKQEVIKEQIEMAVKTTERSSFQIMEGVKAKPGKDGWIELLVNFALENGPKEKEDGRVDYREIMHIPTVERGSVIGIIHPPTPGQPGYNVMNELIPAKKTYPVLLKPGKGVQVIDERIISTESGRPHMEKRGQLVKIAVMPKLTHKGNVDLASGNIRFMGDVEIVGEVEENMLVEAEGDITVKKTVNMATLTTSGAIVCNGNIIGSELSAGKNNMLVVELGHLLGIMHTQMESIIQVIKQLTASPAFKSSDLNHSGLQPLIRILLEKKFKHFPPIAKKYIEVVQRGEEYLHDDAWKEIAICLSQLFLTLTSNGASLEKMIELSNNMKELHRLSETPVEPDSYVTVPNVLNSKIYCSGNVTVTGKGCVHSKIHAGGFLKIAGIIRGGEVHGRLGVEINEVGAESGTCTIISVPPDQKIKITKAMEGTTLKIGNVKQTLKDTRTNFVAQLDQNNRIVFR